MEALRAAGRDDLPVAFFNLVVSSAAGSEKATLKPAWQSFKWRRCDFGEKATKLRDTAKAHKQRAPEQVTRIVSIPEFVPWENPDYLLPQATLTVGRVLREVLRCSPDDLREPTLFQLNYVRIKEPQPGENHCTKTGTHLFPKVDVLDCTGQLEVRMREKVALELSMMEREEFIAEAKAGGINFPTLCSVRILVHKEATDDATEAATEHFVSAILMEAAEQDLTTPKAMPNTSMSALVDILKTLSMGSDRMIVAPMNRVKKSPHAGLIVEADDGTRHTCQCVLSLVAHVGNSKIDALPNGHRIASRQCWNIPFETPTKSDGDGPTHADKQLEGEITSYCTMSNVQWYTLSSREAKKPVYAMVVVASACEKTHGITYMVDKVKTLNEDNVEMVKSVMEKLYHLFLRVEPNKSEATASCWDSDCTPLQVKSRRLSFSPTVD